MSEKHAEFYKIKELFERTGTITVEEIKKIIRITASIHIEKKEDFDFIDNLTNYLIENKNYQDAFFILNNCAKKFKSEYRDFFGIKLVLVRLDALLADKKIELQINPNPEAKSYDHYELIKSGWTFLESHLQSIINKQDINLINRAQEIMHEIMIKKEELEKRFGVETRIESSGATIALEDKKRRRGVAVSAEDGRNVPFEEYAPGEVISGDLPKKNGYGEAVLDAGVIIEDITFESVTDTSRGITSGVVVETESTKKVNTVVNGDGAMNDDKKRKGDETVDFVEGMPEELTLETVTEQLELLEEELVNPLNDAYTHLYILLKIVKLQYDKIKLLDAEIAKKREELEKLEKIFGDEISRAGLELLGNGSALTRKKDETQADIDFLIKNKDAYLDEFSQNKKKAQEAIDALDRG